MSFGSNSGGGTTTTEIPAWLRDEYQQNIDRAEGIANQPVQGYGGQLAAGDNEYLQAARGQAAQSAQIGEGQTGVANEIYSQIGRQSPGFTDAPQIAGMDLSAYQNPYEDSVVQSALGDIDLQRQRSLNDSNAATPRGAFGGSRQGVSDALTNEAYGRQAAATAATLRQGGYDRATGLAGQDAGLQAQNQALNTNIDQFNTSANLQGAQGLLNTANTQQGLKLNASQALGQVGQQAQGTQQGGLDASYNEWLRQQQQPYTNQNLVSQAVLGINNAGGTTNSTANSKAKGF